MKWIKWVYLTYSKSGMWTRYFAVPSFWWIVFALLDKVKLVYEWAKKRFEALMVWLGGMGLNQS